VTAQGLEREDGAFRKIASYKEGGGDREANRGLGEAQLRAGRACSGEGSSKEGVQWVFNMHKSLVPPLFPLNLTEMLWVSPCPHGDRAELLPRSG
jgi:hypothetical protein